MNRYKAAVIGLGNIGMMYDMDEKRYHPASHVFAYKDLERIDLICGVDLNDDKKEILKDVSPNSLFFYSFEEAIESGEIRNADIISICTQPSSHLQLLKKLIDRNSLRETHC